MYASRCQPLEPPLQIYTKGERACFHTTSRTSFRYAPDRNPLPLPCGEIHMQSHDLPGELVCMAWRSRKVMAPDSEVLWVPCRQILVPCCGATGQATGKLCFASGSGWKCSVLLAWPHRCVCVMQLLFPSGSPLVHILECSEPTSSQQESFGCCWM